VGHRPVELNGLEFQKDAEERGMPGGLLNGCGSKNSMVSKRLLCLVHTKEKEARIVYTPNSHAEVLPLTL